MIRSECFLTMSFFFEYLLKYTKNSFSKLLFSLYFVQLPIIPFNFHFLLTSEHEAAEPVVLFDISENRLYVVTSFLSVTDALFCIE